MFKYNLTVNTLDNNYVENNTYFCNKVDNLHWISTCTHNIKNK